MSGSPVSFFQSLVMAMLQGVTELFPISSLGHAVIFPRLLGWQLNQESAAFLPFLVALHLGTAVALLVYFRSDWRNLLGSLVSPTGPCEQENRRLLWLLVLGTVPAGLLGLLLEKRLATMFGRYQTVAIFLAANGLLLQVADRIGQRQGALEMGQLRPRHALAIGASQAVALLPGFSRSGATIAGGLMVGLTHEAAARFGFLLSTPIILAAALLEVPKLFAPALRPALGPAVLGGIVAGLVAYGSTALLMRYFKHSEANALVPFGFYCFALGLAALFIR